MTNGTHDLPAQRGLPTVATPRSLLWALGLIVLCAVPILFTGDNPLYQLPALPWHQWHHLSPATRQNYGSLGGPFSHTLLLSVGGTVAGCGALLGFARSMARSSALTSVISIVLFWVAFVSIAQVITAEGVYAFAEDPDDYITFTWFITRAVIVILFTTGGALLLLPKQGRFLLRSSTIPLLFILFGLLSFFLLWLSARLSLPQTVFTDRVIMRPYDLPNLALLLLCITVIFPRVHQVFNNHLSLSLWLSIIPLIASQLYLIFGSNLVFDDIFNIAYTMQFLAFSIIFGGLVWDYARSTAEEKRMKEQLVQVDRMITIGTIAAGVGHEIKNPLSFVMSHLELASEQLVEDEPDLDQLQQDLQTAQVGADRILTIVKDLKLMSGFHDDPLHIVDVAESINLARRMTGVHLKRQVILHQEITPEIYVLADEGRLTQVLINLLLNASQAMPPRPRDENHISLRLFAESDEVIIEIEDNGVGIPPALQQRIFEPFFTTKSRGEGTGLGLSLSRQIIESFHGELTLESEIDRGSTFRISLPRQPWA